ncbi:MAG: PEP-CTERM sorting domain-containing protein [Phormidesmis priestleyi]|uniref:PEP-CTERM sorting domain-containing protein n=1 Tax=Phormidesmis priestleyi TaxID=268141 RepID=A0A2W4WJ20_9CYAN|nr:MAG: PEP-CTERM sorting domain-containing protein [Phormidesmis priestleyi]
MKSIFSRKSFLGASCALLALGALTPAASYAATFVDVDTELYLSVDSSGSVNTNEFNLQKQGYANAFLDTAIQNLIASSPKGISAAFGYWSSASQQQTAVASTWLRTAADAANFSALISATTRPFSSSTGIGKGIEFAANELLNNSFRGTRLVIDVSGDGTNNSGLSPSIARDAALLAGVTTINGLPIGNASLLSYYQNNVQGGANSFSILANDFASFDAAVKDKIFREIVVIPPTPPTSVPEPGLMIGLVGIGVAAFSLKRRNEETAS